MPLTVDLSELGIRRQASVQLFSDTSATDTALTVSTLRARKFTVDTAPFGGFLAVVR